MATYTETVDMIERRLVMNFERDDVDKCYVRMMDGIAHMTIILGKDCTCAERTKIAVKYQHLIADKLDSNRVTVLLKTNHFQKDIDTFEVWNRQEGFIGL